MTSPIDAPLPKHFPVGCLLDTNP